jgi:8-amino-7-oxononanoate synthase
MDTNLPQSPLWDSLRSEQKYLQTNSLLRHRYRLDSAQGTHVSRQSQSFLSFCSNDYLGLANHPALIDSVGNLAKQWGVGSGASHLVCGHSQEHEALEQDLATFVGMPRALFFSNGYMANLGVISALVGRTDAVFSDRLNHASINDACVLSRAQCKRYRHNDMSQLAFLLANTRARRRLIVSDAVFSMDGDQAHMTQLLALADEFDAWLFVDDAHGFGVLGERGQGILEPAQRTHPRLIYMATLGKAAGVFGAFVAARAELIELLMQRARTYIYTTALPSLLAGVVRESLQRIEKGTALRQQLQANIGQFKRGMASLLSCSTRVDQPYAWYLLPSETAIQPLVIGDNETTLHVADALSQRGILVPAIRPPTVPQGKARLRVSFSAAHGAADVERLLEALGSIQGQSH